MRRKNFVFSAAAAAVLIAFNPALAQDNRDLTISANPNVGVDANVGISNTDINAGANISPGVSVGSSGDQSVSSGVSANQSSTDINSSSTMNQSAATSQSSASGSTDAQAGATASSGEDKERQGKARGHDEDKLTGLDRADQVAGEHGKHGRDNAREKQGLN